MSTRDITPFHLNFNLCFIWHLITILSSWMCLFTHYDSINLNLWIRFYLPLLIAPVEWSLLGAAVVEWTAKRRPGVRYPVGLERCKNRASRPSQGTVNGQGRRNDLGKGQKLFVSHLHFKKIKMCTIILRFYISTEPRAYFSLIAMDWLIYRYFLTLYLFGLAKCWGGAVAPRPLSPVPTAMMGNAVSKWSRCRLDAKHYQQTNHR